MTRSTEIAVLVCVITPRLQSEASSGYLCTVVWRRSTPGPLGRVQHLLEGPTKYNAY